MINKIKLVLKEAGIEVNGNNLCDIITDEKYLPEIFSTPLSLSETYIKGLWDCYKLDEFLYKLHKTRSFKFLIQNKDETYLEKYKENKFQTKEKSVESITKHYDLGINLFELMLDDLMVYSCGYWKDTDDLNQAQINKLELICQKLNLQPGMKILDIGCGFGGFAHYASVNYNVQVKGITLSNDQFEYCNDILIDDPNIEINLTDYRDVKGEFDRIVAVGVLEHIGYNNYSRFMKKIYKLLNCDGMALFQTSGLNGSRMAGSEFITKYIFPYGGVPSITQIGSAIDTIFVMEDWHNFGMDYDKTLLEWNRKFERNKHLLVNHYSEEFFRTWSFYLLSSASEFRARILQLWQIVLSKKMQPQPIIGR